MNQQPPKFQAKPSKPRTQSLLMLGVWIGLSGLLGSGAFTQSTASELTISETAPTPAAKIEPEPVAPAAPEPVAPAVPAAVAPEPVAPAVPAPERFSAEPITPTPIAAPAPVVQAPVVRPVPAVPQASDPYIDTKDYSVGATQPYVPPSQIIVNERSSGCQATLASGQAVAASLCASPPVQPIYASPTNSPGGASVPTWAANRWAAPAPSEGVPEGSPNVSAQTIQGTLNYSAVPPRSIAVKPLTGANPLNWILNGEHMIFPLPIPVDITSVFGWRIHPITGEWRFHSGTDLGAPLGTPVLAAYSGRVSVAEFLGGYGLSILLDHNKGQQETRYAHLSEIFVKPGQWVQQGTVIGLVGSTGNSTGPHLHFETLQSSSGEMVAVDPGLELQTTMVQLAKALQTAHLTAQQPTANSKVKG